METSAGIGLFELWDRSSETDSSNESSSGDESEDIGSKEGFELVPQLMTSDTDH